MVGQKINRDIELLRAVAILLVIFAHIPTLFPRLLIGQWTGVDLFFCISGFVISRSFEQSFDQAIAQGKVRYAVAAFWARRIFRLGPSAWLWLAINVTLAFVYNHSGQFGTHIEALKTAGYFLIFGTNIAFAHGDIPINAFFWSLTLEDQFYFVFPFFLFVVRGPWRWICLLTAIALLIVPNRSYGPLIYPSYWWVLRVDAMMWGCVIYQLAKSRWHPVVEPRFLRHSLSALAVSVVLIYGLYEIPALSQVYGEQIWARRVESEVALISAALVFIASYDGNYTLPLPRLLQSALMWVGSRSYGLYLIHIPLMKALQETWFRLGYSHGSQFFYAAGFFISLPILAEANFRFVEEPLRRWGSVLAAHIAKTERPLPLLRDGRAHSAVI